MEKYYKDTLSGQKLYREQLMTRCIRLQHGKRNTGSLQTIMDNLRTGTQMQDDLDKLLFQRELHLNLITSRGIHYSTESANF